MKMRCAGRVQRIGIASLAFTLAFLACNAAIASDVERQIPVTRDTAGSGVTMEISREGTRQTVTPFLTLTNPTVQRIEHRIAKKIEGLAAAAGRIRAVEDHPFVAAPVARGDHDP